MPVIPVTMSRLVNDALGDAAKPSVAIRRAGLAHRRADGEMSEPEVEQAEADPERRDPGKEQRHQRQRRRPRENVVAPLVVGDVVRDHARHPHGRVEDHLGHLREHTAWDHEGAQHTRSSAAQDGESANERQNAHECHGRTILAGGRLG
jgi:hypothetical protein